MWPLALLSCHGIDHFIEAFIRAVIFTQSDYNGAKALNKGPRVMCSVTVKADRGPTIRCGLTETKNGSQKKISKDTQK